MQRSIALLALVAAFALTACSSSDNTSNSASTTSSAADQSAAPAASAAAPAASTVAAAPAANAAGAKVYNVNCSSCHQTNGQGSPGAFPPLAGNPVVTGDPAKVVHIVKFGLTGAVSVNGKSFNGTMPPWGTSLSNDQIAAAITYIRSSWGNSASAVTAADVAAAK